VCRRPNAAAAGSTLNISTTARIFKLLNSKPNFTERDFGGERNFAELSVDKLRDGIIGVLACGVPTRRWYRGANPSQAHVPYWGRDGHPLEIHVCEWGRRQRGYDIATRNRPAHAIEFIRPNHYNGISTVQCDTLRAALLGLAHYFAQARFGVMKAPAVARS
jgi:hypothetical protein